MADDLDKVSEGEKLFSLHVKPLLVEKCVACHGANPEEIEGGLDLRSRDGLLAGGESFEKDVVIVGDGQHSMLYVTTTRQEEGYEMPPKEADRLTEKQQWWTQRLARRGHLWQQRTIGTCSQFTWHHGGDQFSTQSLLVATWLKDI